MNWFGQPQWEAFEYMFWSSAWAWHCLLRADESELCFSPMETIRTAAERILQASGIQVLTEQEGPTGLSAAIFAITATPVKSAYVDSRRPRATGDSSAPFIASIW